MPDLGVRLQLFLGQSVPAPAPYEVVNALAQLEVSNNDRKRDGFTLTFQLGRGSNARDYGLLQGGLLDPPNRVSVMVIIRGTPQVLINGIITRHQVMPSYEPGRSQLQVMGDDTGLQLDWEERSCVFRNMSDSSIVQTILGSYGDLIPVVTPTKTVPLDTQRVVSQQGTDLTFIQKLATANSFVFYTEPSPAPGRSTAYWGPKERPGMPPQAALTMAMGSATNVEQLSFDYDAMRPVTPKAATVEPTTGKAIPVLAPGLLSPALSSRPAQPLRTTLRRDTANLSTIEAELRLLQSASEGADAVTGNGALDAARYGRALRSRRGVEVRGAGQTYDGMWWVQQVTHRIKHGEYKQSFILTREGRGASKSMVTVDSWV